MLVEIPYNLDMPAWARERTLDLPGWHVRIARPVSGDGAIISAGGPNKDGQIVWIYWRVGEAHLRAIDQMSRVEAQRRVALLIRLIIRALARRGYEC